MVRITVVAVKLDPLTKPHQNTARHQNWTLCARRLSLYFRVTERRLLDAWSCIGAYSTYNENVQMDSPPENHCGDSKSRPCTLHEQLWRGVHQPAARRHQQRSAELNNIVNSTMVLVAPSELLSKAFVRL